MDIRSNFGSTVSHLHQFPDRVAAVVKKILMLSLGSTAPKKARTTFPLPKEKHSKPRKYRKEWERDFCG